MRQAAKPGPEWSRRLGAALTALWYLLVYTHLASFALAQLGPTPSRSGCSCAAMAGGSCCSVSRPAPADACTLPDESMGCHGPRPSACIVAAPCGGELPAAPQTDTLTWPHLAADACALQPQLASSDVGLPNLSPAFSLLSNPPDKVPKHHS